jgi:hypothetical protein
MMNKTFYCNDCDREISNNSFARASHLRSKAHIEASTARHLAEAERRKLDAEATKARRKAFQAEQLAKGES